MSLADSGTLRHLRPEHVERLSRRLGARVVIEHVCLPPAAITLSDLVFQDWFLPRLEDRADYALVERALNKLRRASLILVDDVAEMLFPPVQVYGVLSHAFERDPRADLVTVRWQRYPQLHHRLPLTVVSGSDIPLRARTECLRRLESYLGVPIFRIAGLPDVAHLTEGWDYRAFESHAARPRHFLQPGEFSKRLLDWIAKRPKPLRRTTSAASSGLEISDLAHFCSRYVDRDAVEKVIATYDRFCVVGQEGSVPYVPRRLTELGKTFVRTPSYAPDVLGPLQDRFDCLLICGSQGRYPITKPAVALMAAESENQTWNIADPAIRDLAFVVPAQRAPASGTDWYAPPGMAREPDDRTVFAALRQGVRQHHLDARRRVLENRRRRAATGSVARPGRPTRAPT